MTRHGKYTVSLLLASVIAAPLICAPVAGAANCQNVGSMVRCETNGSVSIKAVPTTLAPNVTDSFPRNRSGVVLSW